MTVSLNLEEVIRDIDIPNEIINVAYAFAVKVTHACAYAATQADSDTMTLKQAM